MADKPQQYNFSGFDQIISPVSNQANQAGSAPAQAQPQEEEKLSTLENILAQVGQSVSFDHLDEITGAAGGALDALTTDKTFNDARKQRTAEARQLLKDGAEDNPLTSILGNVVGSILVPAGVVGKVAKGATSAQKAMTAAKAGAVAGGLTQIGASEETDPGTLVKEGVMGAGLGAALGPVVEGGLGLVGKAGKTAKEFYDNSYTIKRIADAFDFGQRVPDFMTTEARKRVANELDDTIRDEAIPLVDKALNRSASAGYDAAKQKASGIRMYADDAMNAMVPDGGFDKTVFSYSDKGKAAARKLQDMTNEVINKAPVELAEGEAPLMAAGQMARGKVDVEDIFKYRQKLSSLMDALEGEALDIDAFRQLKAAKDKATKLLEDKFGIPIKQLDAQYAKADQFKQRLGIDLSDMGPDKFTGKEQGAVKKLREKFIKASQDPTSDAAGELDNAFTSLEQAGVADPSKIKASKAALDSAAKDARIIQDTFGSEGLPGGPTNFVLTAGEGIRSMLTTGSALAGKASKPMFDIARNIVDATPEQLIQLSGAIKDSGVARALKEMATQPNSKRKAMLFTLMQSPAYRDIVANLDKDE